MKSNKKFNIDELPGLLSHEIAAAMRIDGADNSTQRGENLEYLRGEMNDVPPRPNGSKLTSRDINDTMHWMLPGIMRQFTASDRMASYEPMEPGDEEFCEQATDYANFIFWKDNDGYRILHDAIYNALAVSGDGIIKHWWDATPVYKVQTLRNVTEYDLAALTENEGIEILTQETAGSFPVDMPDDEGNIVPTEVETFNVKVQREILPGKIRIEAIKPEEFLINEEACTIEEARFCAHRQPRTTKSDLIEMGFDKDKVAQLSDEMSFEDTEEASARANYRSGMNHSRQEATQYVDLYECYIRIDIDGDGVAELVKVYYAGHSNAGCVLDHEVWEDDLPFSKVACYSRAHEFTSESVADRTKDMQRLKTVVLRAIVDNTTAAALPQREVEEGSVLNPDSLTSPKFGSLIWKKRGSNPIIPHTVPFTADKLYPLMDLADSIIEKRTGVSRTMMALDPEALQNQTATASQNARDAAYSQVELVARNMAEGFKSVFRSILKLIVNHQDRERIIRLRDEFVPMDPQSWNADMDCTINIGLGTGSRDRDMSMLALILREQKESLAGLYQAGAVNEAIDMLPKIVATQKKLSEAAGIRNADEYWPDFDDEAITKLKEGAAQPKPDPKLELEKQKLQVQVEVEKVKTQQQAEAERMKAEGNAIKEQAQMEADLQVKAAERQNALVIADANRQWEREKFDKEMAFKYAQLEMSMAKQAQQVA